MKLSRLLSTSFLSTSALSLLLTTTCWVYAQEQRDDPKPAEEARPEAVKPAPDELKSPKQDEAKPQKQEDQLQDKDKIQNNKEKEDNKPAAKQEERDSKSANRGHADTNRGGGRIPDDKFRAHFGRQHTFKVQKNTIVGGQPRFQYGGYSFTLVDAWPAEWAYTDDCYVDYVDGEYFLFDVLHPGVRIALVVVL
jgi:flagellar motor protein MotB